MSNFLINLEKSKSFDKRLSLLFNFEPFPRGEMLDASIALVLDKAKYGEHFAQIAYMCEIHKISDLKIISKCSSKCIEHPQQTAKVLRALFVNGFGDECRSLWLEMIEYYKNLHISFYAQILSYGLWFTETKDDATRLIGDFLAGDPEAKEYEELTLEPPLPTYNFI
jgi:hypothetical protein